MAANGNRYQYPRLAIVGALMMMAIAIFWWRGRSGTESQPSRASGMVSLTSAPSSRSSNQPTESTAGQNAIKNGQETTEGAAAEHTSEHPLDPILRLARQAKERFDREVDDYAATLMKRERIKGRLTEEVTIHLKVRNRKLQDGQLQRPMEVYLHFDAPKSVRGREVIWSEGKNDGKLVAHEAGLLNVMRMSLDPKSNLAMMGNKYPVTQIGIGNLITKLIEKGERDRLLGSCHVEIQAGHQVGDRSCKLIQVIHPMKREGLDFHVAQIFIDEEWEIPIRYASYLWPQGSESPPLEEEYTYTDVRLNPGFLDSDFDPNNSAYSFP